MPDYQGVHGVQLRVQDKVGLEMPSRCLFFC